MQNFNPINKADHSIYRVCFSGEHTAIYNVLRVFF